MFRFSHAKFSHSIVLRTDTEGSPERCRVARSSRGRGNDGLRAGLLLLAGVMTVGCAGVPRSPVAAGTQATLVPNVHHAGEGPAWDGARRTLYFVGDDRISKMQEGRPSRDFRHPVKGANGLILDRQGRLIACEAGNRRVTRTDRNGRVEVLAEWFEKHRFNSPNDLSIDSKDRIFFTDPRYGSRETMEQRDAQGRLVEGVYRIDGPGKITRVLGRDLVDRPNGVLVSPDDRHLFVADNNNSAGGVRKLWRFDLDADGNVVPGSRKMLFDWKTSRGPDGIKMDTQNRLFVAAGLNVDNLPHETAKPYPGGVYVFSETGKLLDFIPVPKDEVTNCAFGGADLRTLYITAGGTLWSIRTDSPGRVLFQPKAR
ncbi:MAG: hypothetical protein RLZZ244_2762 [Verrucomicrobiota bacterium]